MDEERSVEVEVVERDGAVVIEFKLHGIDPRRVVHVAAKLASLYNGRWQKAQVPIFPFDSVVIVDSDTIGGYIGEIFEDLL